MVYAGAMAPSSDDRVTFPVHPVGALAHLAVELVHRPAAGLDEQEGQDSVDQHAQAAHHHRRAEAGGRAEMLAVALADFLGVPRERIARHCPSPFLCLVGARLRRTP